MDYLSFALRAVLIKLEKDVSSEGKEPFDFVKQWWTRPEQNGVGCDLKGAVFAKNPNLWGDIILL